MAVNTIGILIGIVWLLAQLAIIGAIVALAAHAVLRHKTL